MKKIFYIILFAFGTTISISTYTEKKEPSKIEWINDLGLASDPR